MKLVDCLNRHEGPQLLMTGTFDPAHIGHVDAVREGLLRHPETKGAIVLPDNWSTHKPNRHDLQTRIRWTRSTFDHFGRDFADRVVVINDPEIQASAAAFDEIMAGCKDRVVRCFGSDRQKLKHRLEDGHLPFHERIRDEKLSSSLIKEALARGDVEAVRAYVVDEVLEEMMKTAEAQSNGLVLPRLELCMA